MIKKTFSRIHQFIALESTSGLFLFLFFLLALFSSNSFLSPYYKELQNLPLGLHIGETSYRYSLLTLTNDGLMSLFFLLVGLEIKRELCVGELSSRSKAMLPLFGALGGMFFPAMIYLAINFSDHLAIQGWAIPTATDIAFCLAAISIVKNRIPTSLKIFVMALAIIDDLGAVIIISLFYTTTLHLYDLLAALIFYIVLIIFNKKHINHSSLYIIFGLALWVFIAKSGIHSTIAGVLLASVIPLKKQNDEAALLNRWIKHLHPYVAYLILPLFAFLNAGIAFHGLSLSTLFSPICFAIILGLLIGKTLGISLFSWISVRLKLASWPNNCHFKHLFAVSWFCGIGFTMSLFIGNLAFGETNYFIEMVKLGVIVGSILSCLFGLLFCKMGK